VSAASDSYAEAGVDTEAGDRAVELMKAAVARTHGPEVLGGVGGFAGLFDASALRDYRKPLLASSTDGVGTKIAIAIALGKHDTIGQDLVGMVVDDIVVVGAKPLFMTDYIACGKVVPERIATIVEGIARACSDTGTALVGGETITTWPAPPSEWSRRMQCSAPIACSTETSWSRSPRAGCTATGSRWCAASSPSAASAMPRARTSSAARSGSPSSSRPASTPSSSSG
jgi:hypothetical protein